MSMTERAETVVIKVNIYVDQAVVALTAQVVKLYAYASARVIDSDQAVKDATNDLSTLSNLKKAIEDKRREYTGPINEHLKFINDAFKSVSEPLAEADRVTRQKVLDYRREQDRKAAEIAEINRLRLEAAQREAKLSGTGEITEPLVVIETPARPPKTVRADIGTLVTTQVWKWEIDDIHQIPAEYLMVDGVKIGKVVRAGLHSIPGIRIWAEDTLRVSSK